MNTEEWTVEIAEKKMWKCVDRADFAQGTAIIKRALRTYPQNFRLQHLYGSILGDAAEAFRGKKRKKMKKQAAKILFALMKRLNGKSPTEAIRIRCEYYYHTEQFYKLYKTGIERLEKVKSEVGYYSIGVGAAWHSAELLRKGQFQRSKKWAEKSIRNLKKFIRIRPRFYNTYMHLALVLGVSGKPSESQRALMIAGRLSRKPKSHFEFRDVRDILAQLEIRH